MIQAVRRIDPRHRIILPALTVALKFSNGTFREQAAIELEEMGPDAAPAMNALIEALLHDRAQFARVAAGRALGAIGPAATNAIPALTRVALQDPDKVVAEVCRAAIGWILEGNGN